VREEGQNTKMNFGNGEDTGGKGSGELSFHEFQRISLLRRKDT
jgi:hypothetical protein